MEDNNLNPVNAGQEEVVEPQTTAIDDVVTAEQTEQVEPAQEVDKPAQTAEQNAQFAKIRREAEQKATAEAQKRIDEHYKLMFDGQVNPYTNKPITCEADYRAYQEQAELDTQAQARGVTIDEQKEFVESLKKSVKETDPEILSMKQMLDHYQKLEMEQAFNRDLEAIKAIYPNEKAKSITDLGDEFLSLMASGKISPVVAYEAIKANKERTNKTPASMGDVGSSKAMEREFFTREEVRAMKQSEVSKNYEKIKKSMETWK